MQVAQSQQAKLAFIANKFGLKGPGQSTQRIIYDSIEMTGTGADTLSFFDNFAGKTINEANISESKLNASEMLVVKNLMLFLADLSADAGSLEPLINVFIGGQRVVKDYPAIFHTTASTNPERLFNADPEQAIVSVRMLTNIVIPPQIDFRVNVRLSAQVDQVRMYCKLEGLGYLFDPKTSV